MVHLPVGDGHGGAAQHDALGAGGEDAHAVCHALLELVGQLVAHLGAAHRVVEEGDLHHEQSVLAADGDHVCLAGLVDAGQGPALVVDDLDGLAELLCRDGVAGGLLDDVLEGGDLVGPLGDVFLALHLRHVHDVDRGLLGHDLIGLLLAVAGGLAHEEVGDAEEGAGLADKRAHGGLDQRAGGLGEDLLAVGDPELRAAAQAGHDAVSCDDDLVGDELACVHVALGLDAELGALLDGCAQQVAGGDVLEAEGLDELGGLSALAGAGCAQKNDVHVGLLTYEGGPAPHGERPPRLVSSATRSYLKKPS